MRNIVVATDGSGDANRAVDVAAELTKAFGGKLFIVTVAGNLSGENAGTHTRRAEFRRGARGSFDAGPHSHLKNVHNDSA